MRKLIVAFVLALLPWSYLSAQTAMLPDRFGSWGSEGVSRVQSGAGLYQGWGDAKPGTLREAGLLAIEQRNYTGGSKKVQLSLYKFKDPSGAYEFYTSVTAPGTVSANLGDDSAFDAYNGSILIGNLVLTAGPLQNLRPEVLSGVVAALKLKSDRTPYPPLREFLPKKWRVFGSEKYTLGPVGFKYALDMLGQGTYRELSKEIGFQSGAEAILAKYQGEHGAGTLLLIEYPTPQLAENHLHHIEQVLPQGAKQSGVTVERKASLLSLVFGSTSAMHAQAIRNEVNYETEVTWNEPGQSATDPPLALVLFKIFLFTTMFLVVATVLGIAFGGLRILIKHWLPGKIFDRPQDIEVLQLGLTSKKIDPTDMY